MEPTTTFLQIDLQNLFFGAKKKGHRIDFEKIQDHFNSRETEFLTNAFVYSIRTNNFIPTKFETKLLSMGYKIKSKEEDNNDYKRLGHTINITLDCISKIDSFQKLILMSGDGDYADLCEFLKNKGKKIEIWCYKDSYSSLLELYADKFYFLDDVDFFHKKLNVAVFGFNYGLSRNIEEKNEDI